MSARADHVSQKLLDRFDLSGIAFVAVAISGQADQLRNVGVVQTQYIRQVIRGGNFIAQPANPT